MAFGALALGWVIAAAPPPAGFDGPPPPLGRVGDVVEPVQPGGYPSNERVELVTLPGCPRPQALRLSRFVAGAAEAGAELEAWLAAPGPGAPPGLARKLFDDPRALGETVKRARQSGPVQGAPCDPLPARDGWKLVPARAPSKLCKAKAASPAGGPDFAFSLPGQQAVSAVVRMRPAPSRQADRCRPRLSAVLFDLSGKARLRYQADFGGGLEVELVGDRCEELALVFDAAAQKFRAVPRNACTP